MDANIRIAIMSFAGTATGAIGGMLDSNDMTNFRLHHRIDEILDKI